MQPRNELRMWNPRKTLVLHNTRETLARLLNRRIRTCAQPIRDKTYGCLSHLCYVCMSPGELVTMIQDDQICYVMWRCYGYCLQLGALFLFCLKAFFLLLFFFLATYAKCSHDGSNDVYAGTQFDTRDDMSIY